MDNDEPARVLWLNQYECHCGCVWSEEWDCQCDDKCPECRTPCEPSYSLILEQL